jgi:thioredoxin reductase (NADPH)
MLTVELAEGPKVPARAVLLAPGASWRRLGVPELEALTGSGVYYGGPTSEVQAMTGREAYVVGGANSAGQAALHLARSAQRVTLVIRGSSLEAGMSDYLVRQVRADPRIDVRLGTEVVGGGGEERLQHLVLRDRESGREETVAADALFLLIGAQPHTTWLPDDIARDAQGFVLTGTDVERDERWPLIRAPFHLETSMPSVFAAGDARHGSVKRVASAVGEGSVAIQLLHQVFGLDVAGAASAPVAR